MGAGDLALMKRTAFIVNPSRGPLIDQDALCDLLDSGHIDGAVIDSETLGGASTHTGISAVAHYALDDDASFRPIDRGSLIWCDGEQHAPVVERDGGIEALDREKADAAQAEILKQYAIPSDRRL